eukprot:7464298-Pyramimonas_sp.AAC.1
MWDKPFVEGEFARLIQGRGVDEEIEEINAPRRGLKWATDTSSSSISDISYSGDQCKEEIQWDTWIQGPVVIWPLS